MQLFRSEKKRLKLCEKVQLWLLKGVYMIYSLRNVLISFAIVLLVVLLLVLFVFSTLGSQEKEQATILTARNSMQHLGPASLLVQEFKTIFLTDLAGPNLSTSTSEIISELKSGRDNILLLADEDPRNKPSYDRLAQLLSAMIDMDRERSRQDAESPGKLNKLVDEYNEITATLEDANRQIMNAAYSNSLGLTHRTFSFVRILSVVIAIILVISFFFIYRDVDTRKKYAAQLKHFNEELEKKVAEKTAAIRESEEKYQLLFESVTDAYVLVDKIGRVIEFNPPFKKILGEADIYVGSYLMEHISANYRGPLATSLETAFSGKKIEYELHRGDDRPEAWLALTYMPASIDPDNVHAVYIIAKDITQRKKTELALQAAEVKYRSIVEQSLVGVYIIADGRFAYVNPKLAEIFGYRQEELIGEDPLKVISPADHARVTENIRIRIQHEKPSLHYIANGLSKDGKEVCVEILCSGNVELPASAIIGSLLDISERKESEKEKERLVHLLNERVKELTALYRISRGFQSKDKGVKETLQDIVNILPSGYQYQDVAAARLVLGDFDVTSPNYRTAVHRQTARFPTSRGEGLIEVVYIENRPSTFGDVFVPEERNLLNMVAEMLRAYFARIHEAEALKKSEEIIVNNKIQAQKAITRAVLNAEEKERNKIGQELHDNVNQILVSVKLYLSVAQESGLPNGNELITNAIRLVDNAVQEIRALSKSQVTPLKEVDLKELVSSVVEKLEDSTSLKVNFEYAIRDQVLSDDLKLNIYRIVQEQLNNILKHADASSVQIRIKEEDDILLLMVADDGVGFDTSQRRSGIGLSNMMNRVESFNGELSVESEPGRGTTLTIRIPLMQIAHQYP